MSTEVRRPDMTPEKLAMPVLTPDSRSQNFDEVALGYNEEQAKKEAERCMNCPAKYCKNSCPLHNDIPQMMEYVRQGDYEKAYACIAETSPMPEVCSRVCAQENQCEKNCTRAIKGDAVGIGFVERFIADWAQKNGKADTKPAASAGKKAAVVGAGPAGIGCALTLAKEGYQVTVFEKEPYIGGVPYYGIPAFVLPKEWSKKQQEKLEAAGVEIRLNSQVADVDELFGQGFDAAFIATGAGKAVHMGIEGEELGGVYMASDYLKEVNVSEKPCEQIASAKSVIVVGGGDTAVDVARCAVRLGAKEVSVLYRRTAEDMPARERDITQAIEEGVNLVTLTKPVRIIKSMTGTALAVECVDMQVGDEEYPGGRKTVCEAEGSNSIREADIVVFALGYEAEPVKGVQTDKKGRIVVAHDKVTTMTDKVFAGGDVVTGANTVAGAAGAGVQAAYAIHRLLSEKN